MAIMKSQIVSSCQLFIAHSLINYRYIYMLKWASADSTCFS